MKKILSYFPEILLISGAFFSFILDGANAFLPAITIIVLIVTLLLWKNRIYAVVLSSIIGIICLYMILALWSELSEFPTKTADYWEMLIVGHLLFCPIIVCAAFMPKKYINPKV
jgi:hypothetical protein